MASQGNGTTIVCPAQPASPSRSKVRYPLPWLLIILGLGLALRWRHIDDPFQLDEFGPLYAIAERANIPPGVIPSSSDPLIPVKSFQAVRERSVLPYGVVHPLPLYHYLLYALIHVLPIAEWSLRLPSVLAGLGCLAGVYYLCRRGLGEEIALAAALLAATDPIQITVSFLARPYALGNLACVLSFLALQGILQTRRTRVEPLAAVGFGLTAALMGDMSSLYLLVGAAQVAFVGYWTLATRAVDPAGKRRKLLWCGAGGILAALLLAPLLGHLAAIREFSSVHPEYLYRILLGATPFTIVILHNSTFLICLILLSAAGVVLRLARPSDSAASALPESESSELVMALARCWFFLPQAAAVALMYAAHQAIFLSRYLGHTTLGGAILLAQGASRPRSRVTFLGLTALLTFTMLWWGERPASKGFNILGWDEARIVMHQLDELDRKRVWQKGDIVLYRPAFLEADFLPDQVPNSSRKEVDGVVGAPLSLLYEGRTRRPFLNLSLSHRRGETLWTKWAGNHYEPDHLYNESLATRLRRHQRFWFCSFDWERPVFLACFLPWLADALGWDLAIDSRSATIEVCTDSLPDEFIAGLTDASPDDFTMLTLIRRYRPKGIFSLGALSAAAMPQATLTVPLWLASQSRTPRPTEAPNGGKH